MLRLVVFLAVILVAMTLGEQPAEAQPPPRDLMARLGAYAERFETMRKRASYVVDAELDSLDGSGRAASTKKGRARVTSNGKDSTLAILSYFEDGADKTAEARRKLDESRAEQARHPSAPKRAWRMPFHPGEQPRYWFDVVEVDAKNPAHVRIAFAPKIREDDTIEGSAWVDVPSGTLLSAGFKMSRPPSLVDSVSVRMSFGERTSLGPAPSRIEVEARGGFLFVHKHYRGEAVLSHYSII